MYKVIEDANYNSSSKGSQNYHLEWKKPHYILSTKLNLKFINTSYQNVYNILNSTIYILKGFCIKDIYWKKSN